MTARRLREWPRAVAAGVAAVVVLIVGAVLITGALAGGSGHATTVRRAAAKRPAAPTSAANATAAADARRIGSLRASVARQTAQLSAASTHLQSLLATARCWRAKARHPRRTRALHCPVPS